MVTPNPITNTISNIGHTVAITNSSAPYSNTSDKISAADRLGNHSSIATSTLARAIPRNVGNPSIADN